MSDGLLLCSRCILYWMEFCLISFLMVHMQMLTFWQFYSLSFLHIQYINLSKTAKTYFSVSLHQARFIIGFLLGKKYPKCAFEMYVQTLQLNMQNRTLLRTVWEQPVASGIGINWLFFIFILTSEAKIFLCCYLLIKSNLHLFCIFAMWWSVIVI